MTDRTSLSVTHSLKTELDAAKTHDGESYESLLWRLLDSDGPDADALADAVAERIEPSAEVDAEAIAEEVAEEIDGPGVDYAEIETRVERAMSKVVQ